METPEILWVFVQPLYSERQQEEELFKIHCTPYVAQQVFPFVLTMFSGIKPYFGFCELPRVQSKTSKFAKQ